MVKEPKIFLSSTWKDLSNHRRAVIYSLSRLEHRIRAMEFFGAGTNNSLSESIKKVKECNIYIGIIGTRYGSLTKDKKSITQKEYETAIANKLNVLIYLIDENRQPVLPKYVDKGSPGKQLGKFKKHLLKSHLCEFFTSPEDLAVKIALDRVQLNNSKLNEIELTSQLKQDIPKLILEPGFTYGFEPNSMKLQDFINVDKYGNTEIVNTEFKELVSACYIALEVSNSNFECLRHVITFEKDQWDLIVAILQTKKLNPESFKNSIIQSTDPFYYRLVVNLAGSLKMEETCEAICKSYLSQNLDAKLLVFDSPVIPVKDVVKYSLSRFSADCKPIVQKYLELAKQRKRWTQKSTFSSVIRKYEKEKSL